MLHSIRLLVSLSTLLPTLSSCSGDDSGSAEECETSIASDAPSFFQKYFKCVTITMSGDSVVIASKGLPPHKSFYYKSTEPNYTEFESQGDDYYKNPNSILEQNISMTIPSNPTTRGLTINNSLVDGMVGNSTNEYDMGAVGVALDSVALFNPLVAPGDDIEDEKYSFDAYNGHPQNSGTYHYHTDSAGPLEVLKDAGLTTGTTPGQGELEVYGIMCDGTVIMGCTELDGTAPESSDLDSQNGHSHDLVDEGGTTQLTNRYHTHICTETLTNHKFTPEIQHYQDCSITNSN